MPARPASARLIASRAGAALFEFQRGPEGDRFKLDEVLAAGALLLGRVTYEGFARAWPSISDEVGFAAKMNGMPKYVASTTLDRGDWENTTVLRGDIPDEVRRLKGHVDGDLLVNGSGQLVRTLQAHDLVDEYRLMLYPVILGSGRRLFPDAGPASPLRLVESRPAGECLILICRPAGTDAAGAEGAGGDAARPEA